VREESEGRVTWPDAPRLRLLEDVARHPKYLPSGCSYRYRVACISLDLAVYSICFLFEVLFSDSEWWPVERQWRDYLDNRSAISSANAEPMQQLDLFAGIA
jgi:hypothetical protein